MLKTKRDLYISVGVICIFLIPDHLLVTLIVGSKSVNFKVFFETVPYINQYCARVVNKMCISTT